MTWEYGQIEAWKEAVYGLLAAFAEASRATSLGAGGGAEGGRTPDLLIANEALSQLSYGPAKMPPRGGWLRVRAI